MRKKQKFRRKRGDTKIGSIEKQYGINFGVRSDMLLETYLKRHGLPSMSKALIKIKKINKSRARV